MIELIGGLWRIWDWVQGVLRLRRTRWTPIDVDVVARIRAADPGFDPDEFLGRCVHAYELLLVAAAECSIDAISAFVSDGVYERLHLQAAEASESGLTRRLRDLEVGTARLVRADVDGPFDVVVVAVVATAVEERRGVADSGRKRGSRTPVSLDDHLTFVRRRGAHTLARPGLVENCCPNCGAAIAINSWAQCRHCSSVLRSGLHDWILTEVTRTADWRPELYANIPGLAELQRGPDQGITVAALEDRASVLFWRARQAERRGDHRQLAPFADPDLVARLGSQLASDDRPRYSDCSVTAVDTVGIVMGKEVDRAAIAIRWHATRRDPSALSAVEYRHLYILGRAVRAVTELDLELSTAHCRGCGAPSTDVISDECSYCGLSLMFRDDDWRLLDAPAWYDAEAQRFLRLVQAGREGAARREEHYRAEGLTSLRGRAWLEQLVALALADGELSATERRLLTRVAERYGVGPTELERMLAATTGGAHSSPVDDSPAVVRDRLYELAGDALEDGVVDEDERALLEAVGARIGMVAFDIDLLLRRRGDAGTQGKGRRGAPS